MLAAAIAILVAGAPRADQTPSDAGAPVSEGRLLMPVTAAVVTQPFGCTAVAIEPVAPSCRAGHFHSGLDLAAAYLTPVHAAASGRARVGLDPAGYGLYVTVDHGGGLLTLYGHLASTPLRDGLSVGPGQDIGLMGSSGLSTGPHLHFEVRQDGRPTDPAPYLSGGAPR
jgi:murein DD-endopeptidase MepM/ murein hydrolase activator NlpD